MIKVAGYRDFRVASLSGFPLETVHLWWRSLKVDTAEYNVMKSKKDDYKEIAKEMEELRKDPK
jgi:hypothetical protein